MLRIASILLAAMLFLSAACSETKVQPNVLLLCVDDLRPELACYGAEYIKSPNIDKLATRSRIFNAHYVQAPTCGASRFAMLTGRYGPSDNQALFRRAEGLDTNSSDYSPSLPALFRSNGYTTVAVGKVSHHPGGMGGERWNDTSIIEMPEAWSRQPFESRKWLDPRGFMHGLAEGEVRGPQRQTMDVYQSYDGPDSGYPDGITTEIALKELEELSKNEEPFFLAVGWLRPHLPFGAPARYVDLYEVEALPEIPYPAKPDWRTTWHGSGEFKRYNRWGKDPLVDLDFAMELKRYYAASVSYADAQIGLVLERLEELGLAENTIIVLWGDHGWHLGERGIWGKHCLFEESLRSPLLISTPDMAHAGAATEHIVETVDLYPTLCDLTSIVPPDDLPGESLRYALDSPGGTQGQAFSYFGAAETLRYARFRYIEHEDGYVELYDHHSPQKESRNVANEHPEIVEKMKKELDWRSNKR